MPLFGIELSMRDGHPDARALRRAGVSFGFLKATQGKSFSSDEREIVDPRLTENARKWKEASLPFGLSHTFTAANLHETVREAEFFLQTATALPAAPILFLVCDLSLKDNPYLVSLTGAQKIALAELFLRKVACMSYPVCLAVGEELFSEIPPDFPFPVWYKEELGKQTKPSDAKVALWRYLSRGSIEGIPGTFDLNFGYAEIARIILRYYFQEYEHRLQKLPDEMLIKFAEKLISRDLLPVRLPTKEKLAVLLRRHCRLSDSELEILLSLPQSENILFSLYRRMILS